MEYLPQQNRRLQGVDPNANDAITAEGKRVVILGGGDTGADCLGTAHRQGAEIVHQYELLPEPPVERPENNPWPQWPSILRTSGAHEEGGLRDYNILTKSFSGTDGKLEKLHGVRVEWAPDDTGRFQMSEISGSEFEMDADLVLLAMGFVHPEHGGMLEQLGLELDGRGNVKVDQNKMTTVPKVFAGGDMVRGQSLVVWAIAEGREVTTSCSEISPVARDSLISIATNLPTLGSSGTTLTGFTPQVNANCRRTNSSWPKTIMSFSGRNLDSCIAALPVLVITIGLEFKSSKSLLALEAIA